MKAPNLTAERLRECLAYDPETGVFTWLVAPNRRIRVGRIAGVACRTHGYRLIKVDGVGARAHRLAWLYMTGEWPAADIDHINGDRADNRWSNLRQATSTQNHANSKRPKHNTSGVKGVTWDSSRGQWMAGVQINGKRVHLGRFDSIEAAAAAYRAGAERVFGQYARSA